MDALTKLWRADSARVMSILLALAAAGFIPGAAGKIIGIVLPLLGGQAVRQTVWSPATVAQTVQTAATAVASQITATDAGAIGQVTTAAQGVVDGVVAGALGKA